MILFLGCSQQIKYKGENSSLLVFSYKVLEKKEFSLDTKPELKYSIASIQLNFPDTIVTYYSIAKCVINICLQENIRVAKFYRSDMCWSSGDINIQDFNEHDFDDCYFGYIDTRQYESNWKNRIGIQDFRFINDKTMPMKIKIN